MDTGQLVEEFPACWRRDAWPGQGMFPICSAGRGATSMLRLTRRWGLRMTVSACSWRRWQRARCIGAVP